MKLIFEIVKNHHYSVSWMGQSKEDYPPLSLQGSHGAFGPYDNTGTFLSASHLNQGDSDLVMRYHSAGRHSLLCLKVEEKELRAYYPGNATPVRGTQSWDGTNLPGCRRRRPYSPIRNSIRLLYQRTFYLHFKNLRYANGRNNTFLCYEVNRVECGELVPLYQGVFKNEDDFHAEGLFLYWFQTQLLEVLSPIKEYKITWYVSWSPCSNCAEQVIRFLATHRNLSLAIFSSRLYYFGDPHYQHKLHRLFQAGAQISAMHFPEFEKCWNKFVNNGDKSFRPWKKLKINFRFQDSKLQEILRNPENLLREDTFHLQFNNGRRIKPVQDGYYQRTTYLCYCLSVLLAGGVR
ncbi:hypothetical protein STEG23_003864 [Scotinomys teguina]